MKCAFISILFFLVSATFAFASIASGSSGNIDWTITDEGVLVLSGKGRMPDYETGTSPWYNYRNYIKVGVVTEGVRNIGQAAFQHLDRMTSVFIPSSVTAIGGWGFYGCTSLKSVDLPSSVQSIGAACFAECHNLGMVIMRGSPTLGWRCLWNCMSLTMIVCHSTVVPYIDPARMFNSPNEPFGGESAFPRVIVVRTEMISEFAGTKYWNEWELIQAM